MRVLLMTMTGEPFQPVRLYYDTPPRSIVAQHLRKLECISEDPSQRCWQWLFHAEAASLKLGKTGYDDVPVERRPIILARLRFPKSGGMTLQTSSIERAVQGARFFARRLGPKIVAKRCRVINRCFAAEEGTPDELMSQLDRDVTRIDSRAAEAAMQADFQGVSSMADAERAASESLERRLQSGKDIPLVEDYPLSPEEETPDFSDLATGLQLRLVRAMEHWRGNTHLTLTAIIKRAVEEMKGRGGAGG